MARSGGGCCSSMYVGSRGGDGEGERTEAEAAVSAGRQRRNDRSRGGRPWRGGHGLYPAEGSSSRDLDSDEESSSCAPPLHARRPAASAGSFAAQERVAVTSGAVLLVARATRAAARALLSSRKEGSSHRSRSMARRRPWRRVVWLVVHGSACYMGRADHVCKEGKMQTI